MIVSAVCFLTAVLFSNNCTVVSEGERHTDKQQDKLTRIFDSDTDKQQDKLTRVFNSDNMKSLCIYTFIIFCRKKFQKIILNKNVFNVMIMYGYKMFEFNLFSRYNQFLFRES